MTKAQLVDENIALLKQQVFHVVAGKYDGNEENCKFADVRYTLEEAEALLLTVRGYPWSRIEVA